VDQQTRQALKQDKFVSTTTHGIEWANENRQRVMVAGGAALVVVLLLVVGAVVYHNRSTAAASAFASSAERAKAANAQFLAIADQYGMTAEGKNALYFAGLTYEDAGESQQAEDTLKKVAGGWDLNLAALAKFALAQLYRNTQRDAQAIELYNELSAKPTTTVPYGLAQLTLADLYSAEGKTDEAKKIYASLKDKDAKGVAGEIAAQKLNPAPAAPMGMPQ
jgi:tetratricopeptide (TPR) repeat protein